MMCCKLSGRVWCGESEWLMVCELAVTNDRLVADISNFSRVRAGPGVT